MFALGCEQRGGEVYLLFARTKCPVFHQIWQSPGPQHPVENATQCACHAAPRIPPAAASPQITKQDDSLDCLPKSVALR